MKPLLDDFEFKDIFMMEDVWRSPCETFEMWREPGFRIVMLRHRVSRLSRRPRKPKKPWVRPLDDAQATITTYRVCAANATAILYPTIGRAIRAGRKIAGRE